MTYDCSPHQGAALHVIEAEAEAEARAAAVARESAAAVHAAQV